MSLENGRVVETSIWSLTASQVRDQAASTNPTPGGGSISLVSATLGLALVHKGASISLKKSENDSNRRPDLVDLCARVSSSMTSLGSLADADARAYQSYMEARSLPRATESEKSVRRASMEAGLLRATQIPLESAAEMCRALELCETAIRLSDEHLLSDIFAGALLICAAVRGVLLNVDANLSGISDKGIQEATKRERVGLENASIASGGAIAQVYRTRISAGTVGQT